MKKIVVPGLLAGLVMFAVSMLVGILTMKIYPGLHREYSNLFIFRSYSDPLMNLFYLHPFVLGLILAWVWNVTKKVVKGKGLNKGINFGLVYVLVSLPGMLISYSSFKISLLMVCTWTVSILVQGVAAGMVFCKLNK